MLRPDTVELSFDTVDSKSSRLDSFAYNPLVPTLTSPFTCD